MKFKKLQSIDIVTDMLDKWQVAHTQSIGEHLDSTILYTPPVSEYKTECFTNNLSKLLIVAYRLRHSKNINDDTYSKLKRTLLTLEENYIEYLVKFHHNMPLICDKMLETVQSNSSDSESLNKGGYDAEIDQGEQIIESENDESISVTRNQNSAKSQKDQNLKKQQKKLNKVNIQTFNQLQVDDSKSRNENEDSESLSNDSFEEEQNPNKLKIASDGHTKWNKNQLFSLKVINTNIQPHTNHNSVIPQQNTPIFASSNSATDQQGSDGNNRIIQKQCNTCLSEEINDDLGLFAQQQQSTPYISTDLQSIYGKGLTSNVKPNQLKTCLEIANEDQQSDLAIYEENSDFKIHIPVKYIQNMQMRSQSAIIRKKKVKNT